MKRAISVVLLAIMMVSILSVCAFAAPSINADEQRILDAVSEKITVSGKEITLDPIWINYAKNYMSGDNVNITKAQADEIIGYVTQAKEIAKSSELVGTKKFKDQANKDIFALVQKSAKVVGLTAEHKATDVHHFTIRDAQGNIICESTATIKATGASVNYGVLAVVAFVIVAAIGGAVCVKKYQF